MTKWRLGEIDDDMWHALEVLGETGSYTKHANLTIVDAGLMLLSKDSQLAVRPLKAIVKKHEAEDIIAGW